MNNQRQVVKVKVALCFCYIKLVHKSCLAPRQRRYTCLPRRTCSFSSFRECLYNTFFTIEQCSWMGDAAIRGTLRGYRWAPPLRKVTRRGTIMWPDKALPCQRRRITPSRVPERDERSMVHEPVEVTFHYDSESRENLNIESPPSSIGSMSDKHGDRYSSGVVVHQRVQYTALDR